MVADETFYQRLKVSAVWCVLALGVTYLYLFNPANGAGYPACPDHAEEKILFDLLDAEKNAEIKLTESFAMHPGASVSGLYFSHPEAKYFGVGNIARDQVKDYAPRTGLSVTEIEKRLAPNLGYEP